MKVIVAVEFGVYVLLSVSTLISVTLFVKEIGFLADAVLKICSAFSGVSFVLYAIVTPDRLVPVSAGLKVSVSLFPSCLYLTLSAPPSIPLVLAVSIESKTIPSGSSSVIVKVEPV